MSRANRHVAYPWAVAQDLRAVVRCRLHEGEGVDQRGSDDASLMLDGTAAEGHELEISLYPKGHTSVQHALRAALPPGGVHRVTALLLSESSRAARDVELKAGGGGYGGTLKLAPNEFRGKGTLVARVFLEREPTEVDAVGKATEPKSLVGWAPRMTVAFDDSPWQGSGLKTEWVDFSSSSDPDLKRHDRAYFVIQAKEAEDEGPVLYLNESPKLGPAIKPVLGARSTNDDKRRVRDLVFHEITVAGWISLLSASLVEVGRHMTDGTIDPDNFSWDEVRDGLPTVFARVIQDWAKVLCPGEAEPQMALCATLANPANWADFLLHRIPLAVQHSEGPKDFLAAVEHWDLP